MSDEIEDALEESATDAVGEALRWLWRHGAGLQSIGTLLTLIVPLRHPEGDVYRGSIVVRAQRHMPAALVKLVETARERLLLE